ncbi:hypothetical protein A2Z22_01090 [Candidatus Woesebacteria bacterium RBG_16_34_12]|uniref:Uncharacterized protein n=1 Tax=Candidatus Woesebacteria bacterium RBG_16_34_12 TaxID=1802480 RepID=A0A1F7X7Z7_9BACT|nr:MAG: hypothetical protein A2Z22_01090 [Candidatus Woesebacteria bacterium RBG_16_34_12]
MAIEWLKGKLGIKSSHEVNLVFGPITVGVDKTTQIPPFYDNRENLRTAESRGVKPLSLKQIMNQVDPEDYKCMVLSDSPIAHQLRKGNLLRIKEEKDDGSVILQFCSIFGMYDYEQIPSFPCPLDEPMFTGVAIHRYESEGNSLILDEVVKAHQPTGKNRHPQNIIHSETILWSDSKGILQKQSNHPLFKPR